VSDTGIPPTASTKKPLRAQRLVVSNIGLCMRHRGNQVLATRATCNLEGPTEDKKQEITYITSV